MEAIIRAKIDQMWQIATHDACGKQTSAVADLHLEISKLLQKLEPSQLEENGVCQNPNLNAKSDTFCHREAL